MFTLAVGSTECSGQQAGGCGAVIGNCYPRDRGIDIQTGTEEYHPYSIRIRPEGTSELLYLTSSYPRPG